jgi:hypothetical protein
VVLLNSTDRGALRSAIEGLLRTCVELERGTADVVAQTEARVRRVAAGLAEVRLPAHVLDSAALAQEVDGVGRQLGADLARRLADARQPYVTQIHALLGLLAPLHGLAPIPSLTLVAPTTSLDGSFPAGFAREYVGDLLAGVHRGTALTRDEAAGIAVVDQKDADAAIADSRTGFTAVHRSDGVELLAGDGCHAAEQHGPQIPDQAQLARLLWLKDPTGEWPWHVDSSGAVVTDHWSGPATGGFTSPEALAKPLQALLERAHATAGSLNAYLTDNADEAVQVALHVSAKRSGMTKRDAFGYRAAGAGIKETRRDWIKAREYGLRHGRTVIHGLPYDPIADGDDPGATIILRRTGNGWRLITCFPVDRQKPSTIRLEDFG